MALASRSSLFLHIPKTCGMWIRHVYKVNKIEHCEIGDQHSHFPYLLKFNSDEFYKSIYTYAFVRHPLSWLQSRWAFRMRYGWKAQHPLDYNCASNSFTTFVENVLRYKPDGWVSYEYKNYIDSVPGGIKFVGRTEFLIEDMATAMTAAGEAISLDSLRDIPRINDSDLDGKSSKHWAKYTPKLIDRVIGAENEIIHRYYRDYKINPDDYI